MGNSNRRNSKGGRTRFEYNQTIYSEVQFRIWQHLLKYSDLTDTTCSLYTVNSA